ncbi:MAG TPA: hypothetical protein VFZ53_03345 [Polyangiaceae bacterium]
MRKRPGPPLLALSFAIFAAPDLARAQPEPCSPEASVSPCFDADALWMPTHATHFVTLRSARPFTAEASTLLLATGFALEPVTLVVPAPAPEGREVHVVRATTTVTLGVGFGLGEGFGTFAELPFVPYQEGTGVEGVTSQHAPPLGSAAVRDPRVGVDWTAFGRRPSDPVALAARVELAPPFGDEALLAGSPSVTLAPGLTVEGLADRVAFGADASLRLRSAVDFGSVRKGSEVVLGLGTSVRLLASPLLRVGVEGWLRPGLAGTPPGAGAGAVDLPAEWLASSVLAWDPDAAFSLAVAAGSGLPLSKGPSPSGESEAYAGVTAPSFRALVSLRFTPSGSE